MSAQARRGSPSWYFGLWLALRCASALILLATTAHAQADHDAWRPIRVDDQITSWESERPGQPLSAFRARTSLPTSMWLAVAVLEDVARACEWTSHCTEMRRLGSAADMVLVYARMDAPWPVRDRDVVVQVRTVYGAPGELTLQIEARAGAEGPASAEVVRMPRFRAHYRFRASGRESCLVEYQIDVDPGGTLPEWLKRLVARDLAHNTLDDLRDRVRWAAQRGLYRERAQAIAELAVQSGFQPARANAQDPRALVLQ